MGRLRYYIELEKGYLRRGVYRFTEYPLDCMIMMISLIAREITGFIGVMLIARTLNGIGNWNFYEICIIFAMAMMPESLGQTFLDSVWQIGEYVHRGRLDTLFVRPASLLFQVVMEWVNLEALVTFFTALIILVYGWIHTGIKVNIGNIAFLFEFVIVGTLLNSAIYLIFNSLNFWFVQGSELSDLVQTSRQFAKYPLLIFPKVIKIAFTYVLPFGFIGYYPAGYLLGKITWNIPLLLPIVTICVMAVASIVWSCGLKGYDSTGT